MPTDIPLECACGKLRGTVRGVTPDNGIRVVCLCDDCQAFALHLGNTERILDANGGTDIFQIAPARITFTAGADQLQCVRLKAGGLSRWYAGCCRTPVANTLTGAWPFAGMPSAIMKLHASGPARDAALGPVRARIHGRYAVGTPPAGTHHKVPFALIRRTIRFLLGGRLRGEQRPSPFFDPATGKPVVTPTVLG